jgi:glycine/D-amino acid oxidase-like deaminating enzyme
MTSRSRKADTGPSTRAVTDRPTAVVVGGGFFGCALAIHLARSRDRVVLLEREPQLMARASLRNQARVHRGYHYPRSLRTGIRSRANYERFVADHSDAIDQSFESVYAIARNSSRVSANQFRLFCDRIGAPVRDAGRAISRLFDPELIEATFLVEEATFNATAIALAFETELERARVEVHLGQDVRRLVAVEGGVGVTCADDPTRTRYLAPEVFACVYGATNELLGRSGQPLIPLRQQDAELALIRVPDELKAIGVTVMDGPYFSALPYPPQPGIHTLSHVRFTPRMTVDGRPDQPRSAANVTPGTAYRYMIQDARRYLPVLGDSEYLGSFHETKVVPLEDDQSDGRPILVHQPAAIPGLTFVVGGKLDNVYDVLERLDQATLVGA